MGNFQKLRVWQIAKEIAVKIYQLTRIKRVFKRFWSKRSNSTAQYSIASNIAEGDELRNR